MTQGQTFFLILFGLYLITGLRTGSKNAFVLKKKFSLRKGWSIGHPLAFLAGAQKTLFFTHFSPLYAYSIIVNINSKGSTKMLPARHTKHIIRIIANAASRVRFFTFIVFYLYFLIIPLVYFQHGDTFITYIAILIAILSPLIPALCFFMTHRKFAPKDKDVRWKNSFYAIMMPWHAMRLADFLFHNPHLSQIHPLSYANISSGSETKKYLSQQYRNTQHLTKSLYTIEEFKRFFKISDHTPADFITPPTPEDNVETQYCPCCQSLFTAQASQCEECENLPLVKVDP